MIFELFDDGTTTTLRFTHEGLTPEKECYDRITKGWEIVIGERLTGSLK
jgi:hypothetical protein